jgi:hypothetical protein
VKRLSRALSSRDRDEPVELSQRASQMGKAREHDFGPNRHDAGPIRRASARTIIRFRRASSSAS